MQYVFDTTRSSMYKTEANAVRAFEKKFPDVMFIVMQKDGKYFPVGIGQEAARRQVFRYFHVLA